jgi:hypothetical protein
MDDTLSIQDWIWIFKTFWNHHKKGVKVVKEKNRGDKPIQVIIHIYKEVSKCNTVGNYLEQQKCLFFFNIREQKAKQILSGGDKEKV